MNISRKLFKLNRDWKSNNSNDIWYTQIKHNNNRDSVKNKLIHLTITKSFLNVMKFMHLKSILSKIK